MSPESYPQRQVAAQEGAAGNWRIGLAWQSLEVSQWREALDLIAAHRRQRRSS